MVETILCGDPLYFRGLVSTLVMGYYVPLGYPSNRWVIWLCANVCPMDVPDWMLPWSSKEICAEGYLVDVALGLCTEYMYDFSHTHRRMWDEEEEQQTTHVVCEGNGLKRILSRQDMTTIHLSCGDKFSFHWCIIKVCVCNIIHFGSDYIFSLLSRLALRVVTVG